MWTLARCKLGNGTYMELSTGQRVGGPSSLGTVGNLETQARSIAAIISYPWMFRSDWALACSSHVRQASHIASLQSCRNTLLVVLLSANHTPGS